MHAFGAFFRLVIECPLFPKAAIVVAAPEHSLPNPDRGFQLTVFIKCSGGVYGQLATVVFLRWAQQISDEFQNLLRRPLSFLTASGPQLEAR